MPLNANPMPSSGSASLTLIGQTKVEDAKAQSNAHSTGLGDLPVELKLHIVEQISNQSTLERFAATCKEFSVLANEHKEKRRKEDEDAARGFLQELEQLAKEGRGFPLHEVSDRAKSISRQLFFDENKAKALAAMVSATKAGLKRYDLPVFGHALAAASEHLLPSHHDLLLCELAHCIGREPDAEQYAGRMILVILNSQTLPQEKIDKVSRAVGNAIANSDNGEWRMDVAFSLMDCVADVPRESQPGVLQSLIQVSLGLASKDKEAAMLLL